VRKEINLKSTPNEATIINKQDVTASQRCCARLRSFGPMGNRFLAYQRNMVP